MTDAEIKFQVALWDAINRYTAACGGDPSAHTVSSRRMNAVAEVNQIIRDAPMAEGCPQIWKGMRCSKAKNHADAHEFEEAFL